jgi:alpha-aminoadipate carrier protein LysW
MILPETTSPAAVVDASEAGAPGPTCPECHAGVTLDGQPRLSEIVECGGCQAELEVLSISPVLLALAPEIEEDWGE